MLACNWEPEQLVFPVIASPKLDGVRCLIIDGVAMSRSLKPIPNQYVQECLAGLPDGFDGELIVGEPTDPLCYNKTVSAVMAKDKKDFAFALYVFDLHNCNAGYLERAECLHDEYLTCGDFPVILHESMTLLDMEELLKYEELKLDEGYEGLILRKPDAPYKFGRSSVKEGYLLKVKRFSDAEATILGFEEQMQNNNPKTKSELGYSKRSQHQENLVGKHTLGALIVRDTLTKVEFNIGTGMDDDLRQTIWDNRAGWIGKIVKYKHFAVGAVDKPRHPVYLGLRSSLDL
jgi:DNA ligase-1